jgi:hypothetical protein
MKRIGSRIRARLGAVTAPRSTSGRAALLAASTLVATFVPALAFVAGAGGGRGLTAQWLHYPTRLASAGYIVSDAGCVANVSAKSLRQLLRERFGPVLGLDNPHVIELGHRRALWFFNDAFVDYTNRAATLLDTRLMHNAAALQDGTCFGLVRGGDRTLITSFEQGDTAETRERFFWALGGEAHRGRIHVFWAEISNYPDNPVPPGDGLPRHPVRTWLATYDADTLKRLSFRPAPNDGVFPQYGFAVASDDRFSYLFGNSDLINLQREGGFYAGPHSATKMYVARVPRGRFGSAPQYRTAEGWSDRAREAVPISARFWVENGMQPRYIDGHWIAVTKADGFWGTQTIVEVAEQPWGPWKVVSKRRIKPVRGFEKMNNYQPIILPYREDDGDLIIVMSQNARNWPDAIKDFSMYRLHVYSEPWPFDE